MRRPPTSSSSATAPGPVGAVALLLLAAGASTRMGQPKQLLPYCGRTLLRHAAETAVASGCAPVVLVTGAVHEALAAEVADLPVQVVHNPAWQTGMASSIRAGLAVVPAQPAACLIMLSDQPLLTPELLQQLIAQQQQTQAPVVAAAYGDALGVPAVFDHSLLPALHKLEGAQGANLLIKSLGPAVGRVPFPGGLLDVDTPEQYAALVANAAPASGAG